MTSVNASTVDIIVPCYNHAQYLQESVESLFLQSHSDIRISIVNDGSSDNTDDIVRELMNLDSRIRYVFFPENSGKWNALNKAIQTSECSIITSHDSDDVALPNRIERQLACMQQAASVHNLCGFYHCWNEDDINTHRLKRNESDLAIMQPKEVLNHVYAGYHHPNVNHFYTGDFETAGASAMFYKDIWNMGMRFNPPKMGLRVLNSEDSDFNFRVTMAFQKTSVLMEKLYCYRRDTSTNNEMK